MDTHVYIDGFNLFYGLLKGTPYKWLDLERFCDQLLPRNTIVKIHYFTARVHARPQDPDQPTRQLAYLHALATLPRVEVHLGNFMSSVVRQVVVDSDPATGRYLRAGGQPVLKTDAAGDPVKAWVLKSEEKGSDVNLAAHLLRDAYRGACKCAVVISNDSDLLTPISMAKTDCGLVVGLVPPREKGSLQLKALADFRVPARTHLLAASQLADPVQTPTGSAQAGELVTAIDGIKGNLPPSIQAASRPALFRLVEPHADIDRDDAVRFVEFVDRDGTKRAFPAAGGDTAFVEIEIDDVPGLGRAVEVLFV